MKFSIVIPAYNEEGAVQDILKRCSAASGKLKSAGLGVDAVEVILVNDGSRDKTEELARKVSGIQVLAHPVNRGYGAAIKTGFQAAQGELLGFLDADGTCDPNFFIELIGLLNKDKLDVAVGSRMHANSRMPPVRILGNKLFRTLVNGIGGSAVADVASGMRVIRREALARLYPLPDGLNFTPAMSVRAVLDRRLKLGEIPMPYEERVGRSKLSVIRDGFRFLGIILDIAITYRPLLFFGVGSAIAVLLAGWSLASRWTAVAAPLSYYLANHRLEDWMIFRITLVTLLLSIAAFLAGLGIVAQSLVGIINRDTRPTFADRFLQGFVGRRFLWWGALGLAASLILNRHVLSAYWKTGHIPPQWWVFPLVGSLFALVGCEYVAFGLLDRISRLLREREKYREP